MRFENMILGSIRIRDRQEPCLQMSFEIHKQNFISICVWSNVDDRRRRGPSQSLKNLWQLKTFQSSSFRENVSRGIFPFQGLSVSLAAHKKGPRSFLMNLNCHATKSRRRQYKKTEKNDCWLNATRSNIQQYKINYAVYEKENWVKMRQC